MATISITKSERRSSGSILFSTKFGSEHQILRSKLKIQPKGKGNQKGKRQSSETAAANLLNSEVYQNPGFGNGKRVFTEIFEGNSVVTHVDHLEGVNWVNYQKRQKIDNVKPVSTTTTTVASVNRSSGSVNCQGSRLIDFTRASSVDSTGRFSSEDNRHSPLSATSATGNACGEVKETIDHDTQLSPKKALRVAMLKSRFADTILKAQNAVLFNGEKGDSLKLQHEKELFQKKQKLAKIKAAEGSSKKSQESNRNTQLERDREASRIALQKMKKTVEIYEDQEIIREVEMLAFGQIRGYTFGKNRLELLGLFLKADYYTEKDEDDDFYIGEDLEEGEIVC